MNQKLVNFLKNIKKNLKSYGLHVILSGIKYKQSIIQREVLLFAYLLSFYTVPYKHTTISGQTCQKVNNLF